jgi:predicted RNA-binding Zn-ribbon protein involved in translation (DUF1610 family)
MTEVAPEPGELRPPVERASLQFLCPRCDEMFLYQSEDMPSKQETLRCPHCELRFMEGVEVPRANSPVKKCWVCGNEEFYVQRDFNRELGLLIVVASAMIVFLIMLLMDPFLGILCLVVIAVVDLIIYSSITNCTVCYLCQSIYRGYPLNPQHKGFYLGTEERFKRMRVDWGKKVAGE